MKTGFWASRQARWVCMAAVLLLDAAPTLAWAAPPASGQDPHIILTGGRRRKKAADTSGGGVHANGETYKQRDKRLARECKGRPNAGACLGYGN